MSFHIDLMSYEINTYNIFSRFINVVGTSSRDLFITIFLVSNYQFQLFFRIYFQYFPRCVFVYPIALLTPLDLTIIRFFCAFDDRKKKMKRVDLP